MGADVQLTASEDCSGGLKMRLPAVWNLETKPTAWCVDYCDR